MAKKARYRTKQMTELVDFLRSVHGRHVTVNEIRDHFKKHGVAIGTATVYRHLEKMVDDGTVAKYVIDGTSGACFEYIADGGECHEPICFHCKCEECGKLIHLECDELAGIGRHLNADHGFRLDAQRTVFYGLCEDCQTLEVSK